MTDAARQFAEIRKLYPNAEMWTEGGQQAVYLPQLRIANQGATVIRDALLWPTTREGYSTRLFLSEAVTAPRAKNWNPFNICGRSWYACSWQGVPATLPWVEILANHLSVLK
ncbi:hypothetical protein HUU61_04035 [Rhodopseudomonas palustris]|nr:hypothetical protein [Rhodopseudomonas palustris]